jgi:hypothetical protein
MKSVLGMVLGWLPLLVDILNIYSNIAQFLTEINQTNDLGMSLKGCKH